MDQNKIAVDIFNLRAKGYQEKFMDVSQYHDTFDLFCNCLPANASVLDIACGPGNITKYLLEKRPDFHILGVDLAPNMIALAIANNPAAEFKVMDCMHIATIGIKYDAVMCGFCLPYLSEQAVAQLIADTAKILHPGGMFYISTMEDDAHNKSGVRKSSYGDEMYMYYHRAAYLEDTLAENGFRVMDRHRIDFSAADGTKNIDLIIIATLQLSGSVCIGR